MEWLNPFWRRDENTRSCWGYTFQITPEHLTPAQMHPLKFSYDTLGEEALKRLDALPLKSNHPISRGDSQTIERPSDQRPEPSGDEKAGQPAPVARRDLYALLRENAQSDDVLGKLWSEANTVPSWVDWEKVARGQDVFYRYGGPAFTGLAYQSLLGGLVRDNKSKTSVMPANGDE